MYLSYTDYQNMGGTLDEATFANLEFEAESIINWYTFNRLKKETEMPTEVTRLMYYLIDKLDKLLKAQDSAMAVGVDGTAEKAVASQSNDGVSVSYVNLSYSDLINLFRQNEANAVKRYLQGVMNSLGHRLLYRGIYPDE